MRRWRTPVSRQLCAAAGPRGQGVSRRNGGIAGHSLGRSEGRLRGRRRLSSRVDAGSRSKRRRPAGGRQWGNTSQIDDGSFAQNFWVDGTPFWTGIQLDELAFPILLAHKLWRSDGLRDFDPYPMVLKAAAYLIRQGPAPRPERWEEAGGYSPSTLAVHIAALVCAANFAADRGDSNSELLLLQVADWLEANIEAWTVTNEGTLVDGARRHYVRLNPFQPGDPLPVDDAGPPALTGNNPDA